MKTCSYCQRPQKNGFYRTSQGYIYCYDCFIRAKERALNEKQSARNEYGFHRDEAYNISQKIDMIECQIKSQGYNPNMSLYDTREASKIPLHIQQLINEIDSLKTKKSQHDAALKHSNSMIAGYPDIMTAIYFESEEAEIEYLTQQKIEEEKRQEEERRKAEEAEKKRIKEEQEAKKRAQVEAKKTKAKAKKEHVEEYIACPKCGRKIRANSVTCPHCYVKVRNYKVKPYDDNKRKHHSCGCVVFIILLLLSGGYIMGSII